MGEARANVEQRIAESSLIHIYCLVEDARSRNLGLINSVKRACAMFEFARKWKNDRRSLIKSISGAGRKRSESVVAKTLRMDRLSLAVRKEAGEVDRDPARKTRSG